MSVERQAHMADHGICPAICDEVDGLPHIDEGRDWPVRDPVIHRDDDGLLRIAIHDPFQTNFLSSHNNNNNLPPHSHTNYCAKPEGLLIPEIIAKIAKEAIRGRSVW